MAAFDDPLDAVNAALAAQSGAADFNRGRDDGGIVLKLGLHQGPCIAVTTAGLLDYFGATVNMTARLEGASLGNDIVLSRAMIESAGVRARCDVADHLQIDTETVSFERFRGAGRYLAPDRSCARALIPGLPFSVSFSQTTNSSCRSGVRSRDRP